MGNNAERFPIRDGKQFPSYDFSEMSFDDVKNQLSSIRPEAVGDASTAYKDAADILAKMTTALRTDFAKRIKDNWQGESAQKALDQLGQIYQTAGTLSDKSHNTATTYNWYKVNILDWYKTAAQDMEDGYIHTDGDDENARKFIAKFSRRMGEAYNAHPDTIEKDLPREIGNFGNPPGNGPGGFPGGGGGGGIPGGGGGGGIPGGGGAGMPKFGGDGAGGIPGGGAGGGGFGGESPFSPPSNNGPHLQPGEVNPGGAWGSGAGAGGLGGSPFGSGSGTDLSSFPGGGPPGGGGGGLPGGGGGGLPGGGGGGLPGGGGGGIPGGAPGAFGGVGAGGMGPGGAGAGMGAAGRGAGGAGGARPMGMPMAPGGGGGAGQGDQERERETWLTEDEDVWGADDDTAPPVIG
ncbi:hypothetical protein [Actinomadura sediminis]|uniref:WXG100 family type VII secretion target n=1 Tax=Actinomadura sediminis TaxID=1038904 RepID=A0ABW3ESI9_9ACTN